jgi:hypothetical protein
MKIKLFLVALAILIFSDCQNNQGREITEANKTEPGCSNDCRAKSKSGDLSCKLATPELRNRKETVLAGLKAQLVEKKELRNGYAFKFPGTDKMVDELTEFIKTERECCDFFTFGISVSGDKSEAWLELTGPVGAKNFITSELGL